MLRFLRNAGTATFSCLLLSLIATTTAFAGAPGKASLEPLQAYQGTWRVTRSDSGPKEKPDRLVNRCVTLGIYFACEQSVNDRATALLVFIPAGEAGHYHTQSILPEGRATGLDDMQISGTHWVFTSRRHEGGNTTYFRNTNVFTDANHIHFENAQSPNGKQWTVEESGDETRVSR